MPTSDKACSQGRPPLSYDSYQYSFTDDHFTGMGYDALKLYSLKAKRRSLVQLLKKAVMKHWKELFR